MMPPIPQQMEMFNIPLNLKHDHSDETLEKMHKGVILLNAFLVGGHDRCVQQLVLYAEMNIKFLFIQALMNRESVDEALKIFTANLMEIFLRKKDIEGYLDEPVA